MPEDFDEIAAMYATRLQEFEARKLKEGRREGRREGRKEGRKEGEAAVLLRLITRRFGPQGPEVVERLKKASSADLERWADNFVEAGTLEDVFHTK